MATTRLTGTEAISHAEEHDLTLSSYSDPIEDGRERLTASEAREIESEGGEVYLDVPDDDAPIRTVGPFPFDGPVSSDENPAAHGCVSFVDRRGGEVRARNVNGSHEEVGPWRAA